jgi:hypothetical protein
VVAVFETEGDPVLETVGSSEDDTDGEEEAEGELLDSSEVVADAVGECVAEDVSLGETDEVAELVVDSECEFVPDTLGDSDADIEPLALVL